MAGGCTVIKVNGSRLDSLGYDFGLRYPCGRCVPYACYEDAKAEQAAGMECTLVFRELFATEWVEASEDPQH
jgi:hypothetical protein